MNLSFHEKSLWLTFLGVAVVFGLYFAEVLPDGLGQADVGPSQIVPFAAAVVALVVLQVVGQVLFAIFDRRTDTDERDRLIALRGARNGGFVLACGVFLALCVAVVWHGNFLFTHVLLLFWVLAQLVETGTEIVLQRRGT